MESGGEDKKKAGDLPFAPPVSEKAVSDGSHRPKPTNHPPDGSGDPTIKKSKPSSGSEAVSKECDLMGQPFGNINKNRVS